MGCLDLFAVVVVNLMDPSAFLAKTFLLASLDTVMENMVNWLI